MCYCGLRNPNPRGTGERVWLLVLEFEGSCWNLTSFWEGDISHFVEAASNDEGKFLLAARRCRRPTYTDYIISLNSDHVSQGSTNFAGKLRSNFASKWSGAYKVTRPRSTRIVAHISYELNVMGSRGPRRMHCIVAAPTQTANLDSFPPLPFFRSKSTLVLKNKSPRWHEQLQCWCLNFNGRVSVASVKNFQNVILQFGKVGKDTFTMDYHYPLSAFQAFAQLRHQNRL